jgi:hypothetical protein
MTSRTFNAISSAAAIPSAGAFPGTGSSERAVPGRGVVAGHPSSSTPSRGDLGKTAGLSVRSTERSAHIVEGIKGVLLSCCYFGIAQAGLFTHYDGALFAVGAAVCLPQWRPYILLMLLSLQDAPGQVIPFDYAAVAGIAILTLLGKASSGTHIVLTHDDRQFRTIAFVAIAVVVYGLASSFIYHHFGYYEQSPTRLYYVVGGLMITMILTAYLSHQHICHDPFAVTRLRVVGICILIHIFLIAGLQVVFGPMFGASVQGAAEIIRNDQAMNPGERGLARLRGPFLSPNALASVPSLFMLILLRTRRSRTIPSAFIVFYFIAGVTVAALGSARTMFVFYLAATAGMTWTRSPGKTIGVALLMSPLIFLVEIPWDDILVVMRLNNLQSLGVRGRLWQVSVDNMHLFEWMFGFGLTHFPVMFKAHLGYTASDPHTWILSIAGMFGCIGLLFYFYLGVKLLQRTISSDKVEQASAICLLLFLIGRELGNTQYVLNNHPLCCLYWLSIGFTLSGPKAASGPPVFAPRQFSGGQSR